MICCFVLHVFVLYAVRLWASGGCVPVLPALLSSSYKRPSASAGAELLEVAPTLHFSAMPPEERC